MSKILVVVFSYSGTCTRLAKLLCSQQPGWQMGEIRLAQTRTGNAGYWRCVLDSVLRRRPHIHYEGAFPRDFEAVVLVSPIWAFSLAGPMRSFITTRREHLPDVAVISVMGGAGAPNAVAEVARLIDRAPVMSTAFTMDSVENGSCEQQLRDFGNALRTAEEAKHGVHPDGLTAQAA